MCYLEVLHICLFILNYTKGMYTFDTFRVFIKLGTKSCFLLWLERWGLEFPIDSDTSHKAMHVIESERVDKNKSRCLLKGKKYNVKHTYIIWRDS